ncbi:MAG: Ldh family oxidoreductase, partial [bacterium]
NFVGAIRVDAFLPMDDYDESLAGLTHEIKAGPMRPGVDEILLPGEGSARRRSVSQSEGLRIPADLWQEISDLARELGVNADGHLG